LASIPIIREPVTTARPAWQIAEVVERIASAILIPILAPGLAACAVALAVFSKRSPLIAHRRVGSSGSTLWMLKLRTMWPDDDAARCRFQWVEYIEDDDGPRDKQPQDHRVTNRFARFCRRHSIDELPQLWHVLTGEMALVGPRPVTEREMREHYGQYAQEILEVKPGLAGLWQVSGRNRLSTEERVRLDLEFVRHRSAAMYARILLRTIPEVWNGANSW
jgi:lipopolysaccharide/colanic/teichoic acid biosynthesis glycosyltransferase